ncbi:hypothetical protein KC336_g15450, partial [Hortaea werneckii]
ICVALSVIPFCESAHYEARPISELTTHNPKVSWTVGDIKNKAIFTMQFTRALWQHRQPMIRFLGKRSIPKQVDHTPAPHPASPTHELPESFASYRTRAQQHGPLGGKQQGQRSAAPSGSAGATPTVGNIGGRSAQQLGSVEPAQGQAWDRNQLPKRFHRARWTEADIEALESGGASMFV